MLGTLVNCNVLPENQEKFEQLMRELARYSRQQYGCIYYDFGKISGSDTQYIVVQKWATVADLEAYMSNPIFSSKAMQLIALSENVLNTEVFDLIY